jgi:hypothetical protein
MPNSKSTDLLNIPYTTTPVTAYPWRRIVRLAPRFAKRDDRCACFVDTQVCVSPPAAAPSS